MSGRRIDPEDVESIEVRASGRSTEALIEKLDREQIERIARMENVSLERARELHEEREREALERIEKKRREESAERWRNERDEKPAEDPLDIEYEKLVEDRPLFDRVVRAISMDRDFDYLQALEWLDNQFSRRLDHEPSSLRAVIEDSAVSLNTFSRDVAEIAERDDKREAALEDADGVGPAPEGEVLPNGQIMLADDADKARLLVDPVEHERAYLAACELEDAYKGEEGRKQFDADFRQHVEAGLDLVAMLRVSDREAELAARRRAEEDKQRRWEATERKKRAELHRRLDAVEAAIKNPPPRDRRAGR